ncbi:hypothetical protein H9L01_01395 [Erysipelothrix inopinata]|uniref:Type II secretion system F family protein n=1 Tax=Erysipelothrix inopinata TaxID=225084 RepID=A0A7G9RZM2_9FIRM|nr:hypothetical protein [Erysipelothrix inopinata]QNN61047.1 hypothetical protein H9L01_01395 [Erysipelothrix inopinata]
MLIGKVTVTVLLVIHVKFGRVILTRLKTESIYLIDRLVADSRVIDTQYYGIFCILIISLLSLKVLVLVPIFYIHTLRKLQRQFLKIQVELKYEFPIWLRTLQMLLMDNTVVVALKISAENAPKLIKNDLNVLIKKITDDPWDATAFDNFLTEYEMIEIRKSMRTLQRLHRGNLSNINEQLETMYERSVDWIEIERVQYFKNKRDVKSWIAILPMFNVTVLFVVQMFLTIVSVIEGGGNNESFF